MNKQQITQNISVPNQNMKILRKHFSHCFDKTGNFNFEKFKKELSENKINFSKESYGMDWLGKSYARLLACDEATTLLKEDEEWNKKEENKYSQNLLIKGDNLEVLKHLSNAYYEKIKMIYIDPPYNTGNDGFVYQDNRKFTAEELSHLAGIDEDKAKRILEFTQSKSNSHSAWLTFMYPRLYIAKQLLRDDGVIFVSIDDNEVAQLRLLMDEIFGEENFVGEFVINSTPNARDYGHIGKMHEYTIFYSKNEQNVQTNLLVEKEKKFKYTDKIGGFNIHPLYNSNVAFTPDNRPNLFYPFYINPVKQENGFFEIYLEKKNNSIEVYPAKSQKEGVQFVWRWGKEKSQKELNKEIIGYQNGDGKFRIVQKMRHSEKLIRSLLLDKSFSSRKGTAEVEEIFNKKIFNFPKPMNLIKNFIQIATNQSDLILDFFAGSGTTGDAVMQLNAEDGGNRKYILVQLPEKIDKNKNKTAYDFVKNEIGVEEPTIFEITKERLIRAGQKIKNETINKKIHEKQEEIKELQSQLNIEENKAKIKELEKEIENLGNQDLCFKIFETIPNDEGVWENYNLEIEETTYKEELFDENNLTENDLKNLLITWKTYDGIPLTEDLKEIDLDGYKAHYFDTKLYLMNKGFKIKNLKKLLTEIDKNKEFNPATIIVFGYNFESKVLREIAENIKNYTNKKHIDFDFIMRY